MELRIRVCTHKICFNFFCTRKIDMQYDIIHIYRCMLHATAPFRLIACINSTSNAWSAAAQLFRWYIDERKHTQLTHTHKESERHGIRLSTYEAMLWYMCKCTSSVEWCGTRSALNQLKEKESSFCFFSFYVLCFVKSLNSAGNAISSGAHFTVNGCISF